MTSHDKKTMELVDILNDLARINIDRIAVYRQALARLTSIDNELHDEFGKIIAEGECYSQQLLQKVKELNGNAKIQSQKYGKLYGAWRDMKVSFPGNTQKEIIAWSLYIEEIAIMAYEAAIDKSAEMAEIRQIIAKQEQELRNINEQIKKYIEVHHFIDYQMQKKSFSTDYNQYEPIC